MLTWLDSRLYVFGVMRLKRGARGARMPPLSMRHVKQGYIGDASDPRLGKRNGLILDPLRRSWRMHVMFDGVIAHVARIDSLLTNWWVPSSTSLWPCLAEVRLTPRVFHVY